MPTDFAALFTAPTWAQIEEALVAALTSDHPHSADVRRVLREHGYTRPTDTAFGPHSFAEMLRAAEDRRREHMLAEDAEERGGA